MLADRGPAVRRGQAIQQQLVATKLKVEDPKRSLRRRIGAVDQKDIPFAIDLAHHSGKAQAAGVGQEIPTDHRVAGGPQQEQIHSHPTRQHVAAPAVGVVELIAAGTGLHRGADAHHHPVGAIGAQHPHIGELHAIPGHAGVGDWIEQLGGTAGVEGHAEHQIKLAPARLPGDQGPGLGGGGQPIVGAGHHRLAAPEGLAAHRVGAVEKLEGAHRLLLAHREIQVATAVEIGIIEATHIALKQAIKAINCWILGADVGISARQVLLEAG